jgi:hypothetical protein
MSDIRTHPTAAAADPNWPRLTLFTGAHGVHGRSGVAERVHSHRGVPPDRADRIRYSHSPASIPGPALAGQSGGLAMRLSDGRPDYLAADSGDRFDASSYDT